MKLLKDILNNVNILSIDGNTDVSISSITFDSRNIINGSLFIAVKGTKTDGHKYIEQVVKSGATAVVCETVPENTDKSVTYITVENSGESLGYIASNYFDNPSSNLNLIGVTGTNGKTTTVTLLHNLYRKLGFNTGLLSTVCNKINDEIIPATHTTPDAIQLNYILKQMVEKGCSYCFMEVSSHAVVQNRISGLNYRGGVFTNITRDHLDYHKTFQEYLTAKKKFFDKLSGSAFALSNIDDVNGKLMFQNTKASKHTYGLKNPADFKARIVENGFSGLQLNIDGNDVWFKLVGSFNAYNLLSVYATALLLGEDKQETLKLLSGMDAVEGRFDYVRADNGIIIIIDYAHTPDALNNVLNTIVSVRKGYEDIITVVGCGGDRDKGKRPLMAQIACNYSNKIIFTSDNPRTEDPEKIIDEMMQGVDVSAKRKTLVITNRKEAIKTACSLAKPEDIILIAGKGHEKYQEIKGVKYPFDDKLVVKEVFEQLI